MHDALPKVLAGTGRGLSRTLQALILAGVVAVVAAALGVASTLGLFGSPDAAVAQPAPAQAPDSFTPTPAQMAGLKVALVGTMTFRAEDVADGNIANDDETTTQVFSPYSGRVTRLIAKLGDHVEKGAPLMAVEASEFVQAWSDLSTAAAGLDTARSQLKLAQMTEKRQHDLYDSQGGALKDWQQSQADLESAQNNFRSAEAALGAVRNRLRILGKSDKEIDALMSAPDRRSVNPEAIVTAPIAGTVVLRQAGVGQYIQSGASNPVYAIGNLSTVWLVANVRETDAPRMRVGEAVEVHVLAYPGRVFKAKISWVAPALDPNTHRLPVRAEVENPDGALKPMMFANFSIITGSDVAAPGVPEQAVVYEGDTARVWVVRPDGSIVLRQIRTGRTSDRNVEVLAGLTAGEKVVTSGALFIDRAGRPD